MAKRVFISFAIEDSNLRDFLVGQAKSNKSPFEFVDMSVKEPWDASWKTKCRTKIKGCDGMIVIVTPNTKNATGQLWEVKCAKEENVPVKGIWGHVGDKTDKLPVELSGVKIVYWTWESIKSFIDSF